MPSKVLVFSQAIALKTWPSNLLTHYISFFILSSTCSFISLGLCVLLLLPLIVCSTKAISMPLVKDFYHRIYLFLCFPFFVFFHLISHFLILVHYLQRSHFLYYTFIQLSKPIAILMILFFTISCLIPILLVIHFFIGAVFY